MRDPIVSIIVPIYNAESTLKRCIDSILHQTHKEFELLLIDDGSRDKSGEMCDLLSQSDDRISVFHKPNGGVATARNYGIERSQGKYILFIDSDDEVLPRYIEMLLSDLKDKDKTIVMQGCIVVNPDGGTSNFKYEDYSINKSEFICNFSKEETFKHGSPYCKIYDSAIIKENNVRFVEQIHNYEDLIFLLDYLKYIDCIIYSKECNYKYYISASGLHMKLHKYEDELFLLNAYESRMEALGNNKSDNNKINSYSQLLLIRVLKALYRDCRTDKVKFRNSFNELRNDKEYILNYTLVYVSKFDKLILSSLKNNYLYPLQFLFGIKDKQEKFKKTSPC